MFCLVWLQLSDCLLYVSFQILSELYHHLANSRFRIDQEKSLIVYNKALQLDPKNIRCYNNRGRTLSSLGKEEEAKKDFITVIDLSTIELETHIWCSILTAYEK